jgi:hypothetical protein
MNQGQFFETRDILRERARELKELQNIVTFLSSASNLRRLDVARNPGTLPLDISQFASTVEISL